MGRKESPYVATRGAGDSGWVLDQLLAGTDAATALDQGGLLDALKQALAERALNAEMDHHLGGDEQVGKIEIEVPRDRQGSFDPQLIAKYQRRSPGFDDKIVSMYARGMPLRHQASACADFRVRFRKSMPGPIAEMRRACDWLGDLWTAQSEQGMRSWMADNPQNKHAKHTYAFEDWRITREVMAPYFSDYLRAHPVARRAAA